ncbi:response regulator [Phaeocystidibacter luteus]|uniref:Response regulator n=1 Tax=Phaeocystidibacter luteus TaxID=911197 RepID=A0A6N6RKD7_9FLAO|nr:response regulator [Phaeocystidibacter luteus]KAB2805391.1 response regulator [Phaeocystidibacter luteus]
MTKPNLLVIDDDKIYHFLVSRILDDVKAGEQFSEIHKFFSGSSALTHLKENQNSERKLILLDLNMPGMSGFEFLEALDKYEDVHKHCTVYIVTSSVNESDRARADEFSIVKGYLVKPLKKSAIENLIAQEVR